MSSGTYLHFFSKLFTQVKSLKLITRRQKDLCIENSNDDEEEALYDFTLFGLK